jgi:protease I
MLEGLRVALLAERGTNPTEFQYSRLRLKEAGATVVVVGNHELEYALEDHSRASTDVTVGQVAGQPFDGVVIPGGLGPEKLRQNLQVLDLVRDAYDQGKVTAAICHGQQVLISAGILKGKRAVAAWSMVDDLIATGVLHDPELRAVQDGNVITGIFPHDLPAFFRLVLSGFADIEGRPLPSGYPHRLQGKRLGLVVADATDGVQHYYFKYRIQEEGGQAIVLGAQEGQVVRLGNPTWEWGEFGLEEVVDRALENLASVDSHDFPYEQERRAIRPKELDALILPGGLGTWMIRGHPGLKKLIREMDGAGRVIGTVGRGPKLLISARVLSGRRIVAAPEMRDDLLAAGVDSPDQPTLRDKNLVSCRGTEDLPAFMPLLLHALETSPRDGLAESSRSLHRTDKNGTQIADWFSPTADSR